MTHDFTTLDLTCIAASPMELVLLEPHCIRCVHTRCFNERLPLAWHGAIHSHSEWKDSRSINASSNLAASVVRTTCKAGVPGCLMDWGIQGGGDKSASGTTYVGWKLITGGDRPKTVRANFIWLSRRLRIPRFFCNQVMGCHLKTPCLWLRTLLCLLARWLLSLWYEQPIVHPYLMMHEASSTLWCHGYTYPLCPHTTQTQTQNYFFRPFTIIK